MPLPWDSTIHFQSQSLSPDTLTKEQRKARAQTLATLWNT
jgi:hypothetical protein